MNCPYCKSTAKLVDSSVIYHGRSYGWAWVCEKFPSCDSYVGCHKGTQNPLGRMANKELREAKSQAHKIFDAIWRQKARRGVCSIKEARTRGYAWLADTLGIPGKDCHIGMMDVEHCRRVAEVCKPYYKPEGEH